MLSQVEENYLKAIFKLSEQDGKPVNTNAIAAALQTAAASVTDMLKRLAEKNLIAYEKYRGVLLTAEGKQTATALIRKHRLWEVFLVEKLSFAWHEVHELAEQLEHVQGEALVERLDQFLGFPRFDPHGDPIPDAQGRWHRRQQSLLADLETGNQAALTGVQDHSTPFLQYLDEAGLKLGLQITLLARIPYDQSVQIGLEGGQTMTLSEKVAKNLLVTIHPNT